MSAPKVALHKEATAEARAAREWYEVRSVAAAEAFTEELDRIVARIAEYPEGGATYFEGTREDISCGALKLDRRRTEVRAGCQLDAILDTGEAWIGEAVPREDARSFPCARGPSCRISLQ